MAYQHNFGRVTDIVFKSLCRRSELIVDTQSNIYGNKITARGNICGNLIVGTKVNAQLITEKTAGECLVVDKPLIVDRYGVGKAVSNDDILFIDPGDQVVIGGTEYWQTSYETKEPYLFSNELDGNTCITIPSTFANECMPDVWSMVLKVNATIFLFFDVMINDGDNVELQLVRDIDGNGDGNVVSSVIKSYANAGDGVDTIHLNDTILCQPGDTFGLTIINNSSIGKILLPDWEPKRTHIEYSVESFTTIVLV